MKFLKFIFSAIVVAIGGLFAYAAILPSDYTITRELFIKAPADSLFPYINNSKKANDWMPWSESDPSVQMHFSGAEEGVGSVSSWESTGHMGVGKAEVVESSPGRSVKTQLTYTKPMEMSQLAEISLIPTSDGTRDGTIVRWTVTGKNNLVSRAFCLLFNMDKMVGNEFVKGLTKLKGIAEAQNETPRV